MKQTHKTALVLGLSLAGANSAFAVNCADVAQGGFFYYHPECNVAAVGQVVTGAPIQQMLAISQAISLQSGFGLGGGPLQVAQGLKGLSAGAATPKFNAWGSGNYNDNELSKGNANPLDFDGRQNSVTLGGDYRLSPKSTVGLSLAYDDGSVRPKATGIRVTNVGVNVAPYFAYQINKNYSVDAAVGLGWGSLKRSGGTGIGIPDYKGDTDRRFAGVNLNSGHWYGNFQVAGKASLFYSHQKNDADVAGGLDEATKYLAQGRLGVQTAYWLGNGLMPYVGLTYVNDIARNRTLGASLDRDGFVAGVGLNYLSRTGITGGVSYTSELGRDDVTNNVFMANVNVRF